MDSLPGILSVDLRRTTLYINVTQHLKEYKLNKGILGILLKENLYFLIGLVILTPIVHYLKKGKIFVLDFLFVKIMAGIIFLFNIPSLIILLEYYRENKDTNLVIKQTEIIISKEGKTKKYRISDIESSIYHLGKYYQNRIDNANRWKMMNSDLGYWDLRFNNGDRYYLTNLLIDFLHEEPIVANTKYRFRMFQSINKSDSKEAIELKQIQEKNQTEKFVGKFKSKSESELNQILNNKSKYQKQAVKAAEILIKNKNVG